MSENGPLMYRVKPLYDSRPNIILPTCMYKMNCIYETDKSNTGNSVEVENVQSDLQLEEVEKHQLNIIQKLEDLKKKVLEMKEVFGIKTENVNLYEHLDKLQDIVIKANPLMPPLSIWVFHHLLSQMTTVKLSTHIHSSLIDVPDSIRQLPTYTPAGKHNVSLTIIWREGTTDHEMMINPIHQGPIEGEVNIARYLSRLASFNYDMDPVSSTEVDQWLEIAHSSIIHGNNKDRQSVLRSLNSHLGKNSFLVKDSLSLADIVMWSVFIQAKIHTNLPANVEKWFKSLSNNELFLEFSSFISI